MTEEKKTIKRPHHLIMEDRRKLTVSAVTDVDSFDEQSIVLFTELGELTVRGEDLRIGRLDIDTGEVSVEGEIHSAVYTDDRPKAAGLFARLFR